MVSIYNALKNRMTLWLMASAVLATLTGCASAPNEQVAPSVSSTSGAPRVLATEVFLADIAQNVAGDRLQVESLIPLGMDPHAFDPTPRDVRRITESQALIENEAGLETWLERLLANAGGERTVIVASAGLESRKPDDEHDAEHDAEHDDEHEHGDLDPHFWLDPNYVIRYAENIRDGLIQADPAGEAIYRRNAETYIAELKALDAWIQEQVAVIPPERRLLVTNHESLGYFADRYGFKIVGTVIPSVSTGASPSAQQMARLAGEIAATGAKVIFLETGASEQLARQIARDTGAQVVTELYTHSLTGPDGDAPSYVDMMKHDVRIIVQAMQ